MTDIFEEPEMTFRERLSLNAEEFNQIVSEILKENEGLKSYIDSGMSDNELIMEKDAELSRLRGEVDRYKAKNRKLHRRLERGGKYGCVCVISEDDEILSLCGLHSELIEKAYRQGHADGWKDIERGFELFKEQLQQREDDDDK